MTEQERTSSARDERALRMRDREALRDVGEALETAAVRMARVVCETGASDDLRKFVQKQWLALAKIQTAIEEKLEAPHG